MKKETWLTKLVEDKFPNQPVLQFRLITLFFPAIYICIAFIIPYILNDGLISPLIGGMFFVMLLPLSLTLIIIFILSFLFSIKKVENYNNKYSGYFLAISYLFLISYLVSTISDDMAGGWFVKVYFNFLNI